MVQLRSRSPIRSISIGRITDRLGINPVRTYTGGKSSWIGDSPFIFLDTAQIQALGWMPKVSSREGIIRTLDDLRANRWLLAERS
jgi:UDP-glucose 4-epimerase